VDQDKLLLIETSSILKLARKHLEKKENKKKLKLVFAMMTINTQGKSTKITTRTP